MRDDAITVLLTEHGSINIGCDALAYFLEKITRRYAKNIRIDVAKRDGGIEVRGLARVPSGGDTGAVLGAINREITNIFDKLGLYVSSLHIEAEKKKNVFKFGR